MRGWVAMLSCNTHEVWVGNPAHFEEGESMISVVYIVKPLDHNQELRYSLRSLANIPHGDVYMFGGPRWVKNVERLPYEEQGKWATLSGAMKVAAENFDEFLFMNDDFFIMEKIEEMPILHRGSVKREIRSFGGGSYVDGRRAAYIWLGKHGHKEPLCYEVHAPIVIKGPGMVKAFDMLGKVRPNGWMRTIYGNINEIGGTKVHDVKYGLTTQHPTGPFMSTTDGSFRRGYVGDVIRARFKEKSIYE